MNYSMKKQLNDTQIINELRGGSSFFKDAHEQESAQSPIVERPVETANTEIAVVAEKITKQLQPERKPEKKQENQPSNSETVVSRYRDTTIPQLPDTIIESVRKAVKQLGKEAATYRFTQEEKRALSDIVYTYKSTGIRTSENEITRTAINFLVEEYKQNGANSILALVIARLNS